MMLPRFNIGEGQEENAIVTSTGQYVIAWDFGKVKKGQMDKYEIKKYEDLVVQDNFRFGDDKEIVRLYMARETVRSLIAFVLDCRTAE
jgi:VID27 C-terminal WD40-like domain